MANYYTLCQTEAALCIWEELTRLRMIDEINFDQVGTVEMRHRAINAAPKCDADYQLVREQWQDRSFDWDFVPEWVQQNMKEFTHG